MRLSYTVGATCVLVTGLVIACGSSDRTRFEDPNAGGNTGFGDGDGGNGCTECSADLRSVLTCGDNPTVIKTCPEDQGCGGNGCIAPCDAAAANKSSIGCNYYAVAPDVWHTNRTSGGAAGSCFAAFVTNTWPTPLKVTLGWKGTTIDATPYAFVPKGTGTAITYDPVPSTGIPPNGMAIVFLNQWAAGQGLYKVPCPAGVQAAIEDEDVVTHDTGLADAIEIRTSVPAVVYDIYPFGGATSFVSSATLLLPTTAWDNNYVAVTMSSVQSYPSGIDLVAQQDGTEITLLPNQTFGGGPGVSAGTANMPVVYTLNKGQVVHIMQTPSGTDDLTGSVVQANHPVGVWGEHFCMTGSDPPKWRIVGAVDGTALTYDPAVPGAPATLSRSQLVEFAGPPAFRVKAQDDAHPFYLAAARPGGDCDAAHQQIPPVKALGFDYIAVANESTDYSVGGPETVNVVPSAQFMRSYTFFSDPTYGWTELALTRKKAADGKFKNVDLDCLGNVTGWTAVGTGGDFEYAHVALRRNRTAQGGCDNGRHTIKSDEPFGITVWGYDSASSYAYPAGASVKPINSVIVPAGPK